MRGAHLDSPANITADIDYEGEVDDSNLDDLLAEVPGGDEAARILMTTGQDTKAGILLGWLCSD